MLGCLCISAGMGDSSNRALTNLLALECIFSFFQVSCPAGKHAPRAADGLPRPAPSVAFWEHLVTSLGLSSLPSQPSEEPGAFQEIPVTDLKPATDWTPDSEVSECQTCMKSFSFLVRKHHCRLCGRVVCGECSRYRMVLERTNKPVRVCRTCYFGHMNDGGTRMVTAAQVAAPLSKDDFQLLKVIGKGSFGKVLLVRSKRDHKVYALKILMKSRVLARKQVEHTRSERKILEEIDHPFLCRLEFAFQTEGKLYIGMEFLAGGPLFYHLQQVVQGLAGSSAVPSLSRGSRAVLRGGSHRGDRPSARASRAVSRYEAREHPARPRGTHRHHRLRPLQTRRRPRGHRADHLWHPGVRRPGGSERPALRAIGGLVVRRHAALRNDRRIGGVCIERNEEIAAVLQ